MKASLPQSSVIVQVTLKAPVRQQAGTKLARSKSLLTVTPLHKSEAHDSRKVMLAKSQASAAASILMTSSHSCSAEREAGGHEVRSGAIVSSMVNTAVTVLVLLHSSVTVYSTVRTPVVPQAPIRFKQSKSCVTITSPQTSSAQVSRQEILERFQAVAAASLLAAPLHSCVSSSSDCRHPIKLGLVVSSIVRVACIMAVLQPSLTLQVTSSVPAKPHVGDRLVKSKSLVTITLVQISVAQPSKQEILAAFQSIAATSFPTGPAHSVVSSMSAESQLIRDGASVSSTVNKPVIVVKLLHPSVTVQVTSHWPVPPHAGSKLSKSKSEVTSKSQHSSVVQPSR